MTQAAKKLLDQFEALPDKDRPEVLAELLRRAAMAPHDLSNDEDFVIALIVFSSNSIVASNPDARSGGQPTAKRGTWAWHPL